MGEMCSLCTCTTEMSRRSSCSGENHLPPVAHVRRGTCRHVAARRCGNETGRYIDAAAKRQRRAQRQSHSTKFLTVGLTAGRPSPACLFFLPFGEYNIISLKRPGPLSLVLHPVHHFQRIVIYFHQTSQKPFT